MGEVGEEVKKLSLPEVTAPWQKFSANMLLIPYSYESILCISEAEGKRRRAVRSGGHCCKGKNCGGCEARRQTESTISFSHFTASQMKSSNRVEFLAEEAMPE